MFALVTRIQTRDLPKPSHCLQYIEQLLMKIFMSNSLLGSKPKPIHMLLNKNMLPKFLFKGCKLAILKF